MDKTLQRMIVCRGRERTLTTSVNSSKLHRFDIKNLGFTLLPIFNGDSVMRIVQIQYTMGSWVVWHFSEHSIPFLKLSLKSRNCGENLQLSDIACLWKREPILLLTYTWSAIGTVPLNWISALKSVLSQLKQNQQYMFGFWAKYPVYSHAGGAEFKGWRRMKSFFEQGPIDLCFMGSRVCWSCCLAYLKVFG